MPPAECLTAIGVIGGTSMDGIDVAMPRSDGARVERGGKGGAYPYPADLRADLLEFLAEPARAEIDPLTELEARTTDAHVVAIRRFVAEHGVDLAKVDIVGMHGQTVWHRPERRFTRQLADGARAAAALGVDVVTRFRDADVAAGGQGAPFAPLYRRALAEDLAKPPMVLKLGGVGNVTYIDRAATIAFDTGPASALLDDFVRRRRGLAFDEGGKLAASGAADGRGWWPR